MSAPTGAARSSHFPRPAPDGSEVTTRLRRGCEELLVTAEPSHNLVVVRTPPGAASFLASAVDHADIDDLLGTIAGDDTIMLITTGAPASRRIARRRVPGRRQSAKGR